MYISNFENQIVSKLAKPKKNGNEIVLCCLTCDNECVKSLQLL